ncbi:hypothetical protein [Mucilaginibacter sp. FT3.2]|uniref:hypothetical protein n=1 Tax=Mucilaginibacter sp. FT3.2 TaxID=2723090 RepID=UPI00161BF488|nr:hypothetical protein [Mucilaginibacter sp. FT3.2]MBB6234275.1 hypothetical protein [Mucilaginibacter sp. FT3.2]
MKVFILCPIILLLHSISCFAQQKALNIAGIWQLVDESKSENALQVKARNKQTVNTADEYTNKTMLAKLKNTYRTIQQRYSTLGTAINAATVGLDAKPMMEQIISNQSELYNLAKNNPAIMALAYKTEIAFADKAQMLIRYLIGICISIGDINQMKASDRKILFDYLLSELSNLEDLSSNLNNAVRYANLNSLIRSANPLRGYIDQDKEIAGNIITNAKPILMPK